ncbi:glycosyltransferase family 4 protein [Paraurantiacibacter namhicola]|uniref:GDP-mannose-dependent alpha-mannosyltransferase n=1 Tax=Paraurantiacibacter namhicola TaxID=645517 RepID=A0A1C7DAN5_9SPHN|nr:glycosyltransferase family 1 protein [Paraurantiacibacter namhicola]ANU08514.1 GDP-mannose-dependent alpha-mannosyltransferase [Paraurantiacibacter namhicola]
MDKPERIEDLRVALFSGNYNYVRDGANQALNRLVDYLLRQGCAVRVYSPVVDDPAFPPTGDLVDVPNTKMPMGRGEYRMPLGLNDEARRDLEAFAPNLLHLSSPDPSGHAALKWARKRSIPVVASVHTRFDTYPRYYKLGFIEPAIRAMLRRFYGRCDAVLSPTEVIRQDYLQQGFNDDIRIWERGVDRTIFNPGRRDMAWRRELGIADDEIAIGFLGRLVLEKGLGRFAEVIELLAKRGVPHKVLAVGEGPAHDEFAARVPEARFAGFQTGADLGRAVASMDLLFNASITEAFSNVTLEAMACARPVLAVDTTGSNHLVIDGVTGRMVKPDDTAGFADALEAYIRDPALRAAHGEAGEERSHLWDWDPVNQAVADTYLQLVSARAA